MNIEIILISEPVKNIIHSKSNTSVYRYCDNNDGKGKKKIRMLLISRKKRYPTPICVKHFLNPN